MRILLVNTNRFHYPWPVIPFGLCYVASSLERRGGHDVQFLDLCFEQDPAAAIAKSVARFRPGLVGLTIRNIDNGAGYEPVFLVDRVRDEVVAPLRAVFGGPVVIGGPAVGINAAEILERLGLDLAIRGDGEDALLELVTRLAAGAPLDGIPGLVRRVEGVVVTDAAPRQRPDLDALPWPDIPRYVDVAAYRAYGSPMQVQTKRGCEQRCTYCTYRGIEGCRYRLRDPEAVADEVLDLYARTGVVDFELTDSTFNLPIEHAKAVLRALLSRGRKLKLRTMGLNPAGVDEELVDLMAAVGFRDVDLGVESACEPILRELGKGFGVADIERAGRLLRSRGIAASWFLLLGAPSETRETARETLETVARLAAPSDLVLIAVGLRAYNGAPLAEALRRADPSVTADNFLTPVAVIPRAIGLADLAVEVKRFCIEHPSFLMFNEEYDYPVEGMRYLARLGAVLNPGGPSWQVLVFARRVGRALGLARAQRALFEVSHLVRPYRPRGGYGPERFRGPRVGTAGRRR
jgi:hypothetical protein